jgi:acyl-CoA thioesterase FadM
VNGDRFMQKYVAVSHQLCTAPVVQTSNQIEDGVVAEGEAVVVTFDHVHHRKAPVPEEVVKAMKEVEGGHVEVEILKA